MVRTPERSEEIIIFLSNLLSLTGPETVPAAVTLRLERQGQDVLALVSLDGVEWFSPGRAKFPVEGEVEVGVHAVGWIDRTIYPGAYPDGAAIRLESFKLMQ